MLTLGTLQVPLAGEAQQATKVWRIGLMHVGLDHAPRSVDTFRETLKALRYEEGKDLRLLGQIPRRQVSAAGANPTRGGAGEPT
jgi:hypothetical protein